MKHATTCSPQILPFSKMFLPSISDFKIPIWTYEHMCQRLFISIYMVAIIPALVWGAAVCTFYPIFQSVID